MRLPVEVLQAHLGQMLEGLLLWSEDSKNKFRLKVRPVAPPVRRARSRHSSAAPAAKWRVLQHACCSRVCLLGPVYFCLVD